MNLFQNQSTEFQRRHNGLNQAEINKMLEVIGVESIEELIKKTVPTAIQLNKKLDIPAAVSEFEYLNDLKKVAAKNKGYKTYIGQGYYNTITPSVILRNVFENPGWYTQYTPYQAEISQGRLESLLNYQTMICDLTGLELANASLLDEATAAAEAMAMLFHHGNDATKTKFFVDEAIFPQTKDLLVTRATPINIKLVFGDYKTAQLDTTFFGAMVQYPNNNGSIQDYKAFINKAHSLQAFVVMATDLLALTLLTSPGELGADVAVGNSQRFGVPLGYGGPHAAFFATKDEFKRGIPGRIIGISIDAQNNRALRMALQTREQHIKREKATSNICTAQALLANMAAMYAVYHGAEGLKNIAKRVSTLANVLSVGLTTLGFNNINKYFFDTLCIACDAKVITALAIKHQVNFRMIDDKHIGISIDETTSQTDVLDIIYIFAESLGKNEAEIEFDSDDVLSNIPTYATRTSTYLEHKIFNIHHSESQMMRYIKLLENKDLSLNRSMIALGSCTMKLNAATEMIPVSWAEFSQLHPFVPQDQALGYKQITDDLSAYLCEITGFDACSLQPNSGAQGEYAGLLTIMAYHIANNNAHRNVVLIPVSAHGTNPASAVMAGMKVVIVKNNEDGTINFKDLQLKATEHKDNLGGLMVTYPSTYGVFEENIKEICALVHEFGGQVYMDGANMNAQVGLTSPAAIGADVCHLNLHKTFAIPHGGGGPGMGPICVREHLAGFLPGHSVVNIESGVIGSNRETEVTDENSRPVHEINSRPTTDHQLSIKTTDHQLTAHNAVSATPFGSASILLISYAYIKMLGFDGVKMATEYAILNANYMKVRLEKHYSILYTGKNGTCAHEFIVDLRPYKTSCGIEAEDVAKRLIDYGFHAPTMSFPVAGTIMIEPTESEDKAELDRFCDALIAIHAEIKAIEEGKADKTNNALKNAPHTLAIISANEWDKPYTRQQAAFPLPYVSANKFWPSVARVNNTYGDRNLVCACEPTENYA